MRNFRTYHLAVALYGSCRAVRLTRHLKEQLERASASVVLNLAEGAGRQSQADQRRFFRIAFGSLRVCQAVLDLSAQAGAAARGKADVLAAHLYRLLQAIGT